MCQQTTKHSSSYQQLASTDSLDKSIGDLFRDYGEAYIRSYSPELHKIKFIRSVRVCKTPALGGKTIVCKDCGHQHHIYLSCGNSQCPLCQSIKRLQWQDRLSNKLLKVPYVHAVFTVPHELNSLAKLNKRIFYSLILRIAWKTVKTLSADSDNLGALPGMVPVLHTFGSDMKYHLHAHCLITFGGINNNSWLWPKRKKKIAPFRAVCKTYRNLFLAEIRKLIAKRKLIVPDEFDVALDSVSNKRWNVRHNYPSMDTQIIQRYLARYINRIAISKSRLFYNRQNKRVDILYNDYRNQKEGKPAPKAYKHMHPLVAIDQILKHLLPPYFQKVRYYGLHAHQTFKKLEHAIPDKLKHNSDSVRNLFAILKSLLNQDPYVCEHCQSKEYEIKPLSKKKQWVLRFIHVPASRAPPIPTRHIKPIF